MIAQHQGPEPGRPKLTHAETLSRK